MKQHCLKIDTNKIGGYNWTPHAISYSWDATATVVYMTVRWEHYQPLQARAHHISDHKDSRAHKPKIPSCVRCVPFAKTQDPTYGRLFGNEGSDIHVMTDLGKVLYTLLQFIDKVLTCL